MTSFSEIDNWLLTTVPGVILLGALGSILAVMLIKLVKEFLPSGIKKINYNIGGWIAGALIKPVSLHQSKLLKGKKSNKYFSFYVLHIMKLLFNLFFSLLSLIFFLYSLTTDSVGVVTPVRIICSGFFFFFLWKTFRSFIEIWIPAMIDTGELLKKTVAKDGGPREFKDSS